jgi:hypothetical protein
MIQNVEKWRKWEDDYIASERPSHAENLRLADSMIALAVELGVFPPANPLDDLDHKIQLAKALNVRISPPSPR